MAFGGGTLFARQGIVGGAILLVLALGVAIALTLGGENDHDPARVEATATSRPEVEASDVVQRFVEALGTDDIDTLYAIQAESYKQICARDEFESFAAQLQTSPLEGPAQVVVQGDAAQASLYEVQADGTREQVFVPLVREPNGDWRIAPPSTTGCLP
jgi:hypothetical protein